MEAMGASAGGQCGSLNLGRGHGAESGHLSSRRPQSRGCFLREEREDLGGLVPEVCPLFWPLCGIGACEVLSRSTGSFWNL